MHKLFIDLDGVLVDFDAGVRNITGSPPDALTPHVMWRQLARAEGFYEHLGWMDDGRELWESVLHLAPTILTGLPLGHWAEPQKRAWCTRELGPDIPVITCMSRDKARLARASTPEELRPVLVDDRLWQRDAWEAMGGVFVHHRDAAGSIARVRELFA